ncbi:cadherin-related family member 5 [Brachyistius frenatus]|uniref:cadherin-related family member 5 n=1 Tax=Brachyistius frenatus TaxID=100188 RepID=UPI0037E8800F
MLPSCRLLLWQAALRVSYHVVTASLCLGGSDILASVRENSPMGQFVSNISISSDPGAAAVRLCLSGQHADWFFLEGRTVRLNSSLSRVLDREVQGSMLIAELTCYEDDVIQSRFRILVEVLNENDNKPHFLPETIQPLTVSELASVNSAVFTVRAIDADEDTISYIIDQSSRDAGFFRIDLPNSGTVVLKEPLDYETRTNLQIVMWAQESNTVERFNTSTVLTVNIEDSDDQYPQFLPCTPVSPGVPVCMSPIYTANITQTHQDAVLEFSPGPIRAKDGDRGIDCPLTYSILSGGDQGRFAMDNRTGEIRLTRPVDDRRLTPNFRLNIMVQQVDDRLKYSVTSVLVRVLSKNTFPPVFNRTTFRGFIIQSSSPASIVSTYGNQVLQVQVSDRDFFDGLNPNIHYSLHPPSELYQVTRGGVLIACTDKLHAFDRHILQVVARDEESGEEASASVDVEVLQRGQAVPGGAFTEQQLFRDVDTRLAGGVALIVLLVFLSALVFVLLRIVRRRRRQEAEDGAAAAVGKHLDVVSSGPPVLTDESSYGRAFSRQRESSSPSDSLHGRQGVYTRRPSVLPPPPPLSSSGRYTWETLRSDDVRGGLRSTGFHGDDITALDRETPQRDADMETDQSESRKKPS